MKGPMLLLSILLIATCDIAPTPVDWSRYHASVKERIDQLAEARDCEGLQREFDIAHSNDGAQRARTGRGTSDLMGYIDDKLETAACYR